MNTGNKNQTTTIKLTGDFSRQLERENARLRWKYAELGLYVDADYARLRSELEAKMEDGKGHSRLRNKTRTNT